MTARHVSQDHKYRASAKSARSKAKSASTDFFKTRTHPDELSFRITTSCPPVANWSAVTRTASRNLARNTHPEVASKAVEPGWVVHQDLLTDGQFGRPNHELVEEPSVIDLEQRCHLVSLAADRHGFGMRPVCTPKNAIGIGRDQGSRQRRHIRVV